MIVKLFIFFLWQIDHQNIIFLWTNFILIAEELLKQGISLFLWRFAFEEYLHNLEIALEFYLQKYYAVPSWRLCDPVKKQKKPEHRTNQKIIPESEQFTQTKDTTIVPSSAQLLPQISLQSQNRPTKSNQQAINNPKLAQIHSAIIKTKAQL